MIKLKPPEFWSKKNWLSKLMALFSYIYIFLGFLRASIVKEVRLPQKVICVGNITVGGGGKTQIVAWLAQALAAKNISLVIVTKAYKSDLKKAKLVENTDTAKKVGDESIILRKFGSVIAAKRIKEAIPLINMLNPKVVILDDGMQNPLLKKDITILAIDPLTGVGNNKIFPAGHLRESMESGFKKADLIFMIGNAQCEDSKLINNINLSGKSFFKARIKLKENLDKNTEYIAFTGIANPEKFYSLLSENNFKVKQYISLEDHYNYSERDIKKLLNLATSGNCSLITTEKDYVKIDSSDKALIKCAQVELDFEKEQECINLIYEKLL